jgi:hypothetical protein
MRLEQADPGSRSGAIGRLSRGIRAGAIVYPAGRYLQIAPLDGSPTTLVRLPSANVSGAALLG